MPKGTAGFDQIIGDFGVKIGMRIMKRYGGMRICEPDARIRAIRDRNIWKDYSERGMPDYELAARYNLKKTVIVKILAKMRRQYKTSS